MSTLCPYCGQGYTFQIGHGDVHDRGERELLLAIAQVMLREKKFGVEYYEELKKLSRTDLECLEFGRGSVKILEEAIKKVEGHRP